MAAAADEISVIGDMIISVNNRNAFLPALHKQAVGRESPDDLFPLPVTVAANV